MSSIFFVVMYPTYGFLRKSIKKTTLTYMVLAIALVILWNPVFNIVVNVLGRYSEHALSSESFLLASFLFFSVYTLIFVFVLLERSVFNKKTQDLMTIEPVEIVNAHGFYELTAALLTWIVSIIGLSSSFMVRIESFFCVLLIAVLPSTIEKIENANNRRIIRVIVIISFVVLFYVISIYRPNWDRVFPYYFKWGNT